MDDPAQEPSTQPGPEDGPEGAVVLQSALGYGPNGAYRWSVQAEPSRGEHGAREAGIRVVNYLNRHGQDWTSPVPPSREQGVDVVSTGPLGELRMQVTRVPSGQADHQALAKHGHVGGESTAQELARHLMEAIRHKAPPGQEALREGLVLVLDAQQRLVYGELAVLDAFDTQFGTEATAAGFREVWLVTAMHTHRLVPGEWPLP